MERNLRILCLHGHGQRGATLRAKMGSLRKMVKRCDFVFEDAPHAAPERAGRGGGGGGQPGGKPAGLSWWERDSGGVLLSEASMQASSASLLSVLRRRGNDDGAGGDDGAGFNDEPPFDGILGFSQGAAMAALLCDAQARSGERLFRFCCLFSGFAPLAASAAAAAAAGRGEGAAGAEGADAAASGPNEVGALMELTCDVPSFHSWGLSDEIIVPARSRALADAWGAAGLEAAVAEHGGGHLVSSDRAVRLAFREFCRARRDEIASEGAA